MVTLSSQFIPGDFPLRFQLEGFNFVAFIQAYYEWLEQTGNPVYLQNNLTNYTNINDTLDQFLNYFQYEIMNSFPNNMAANPRLAMKHIIDLYRAKGTPRGFALFFRILFNEDISLYLPGTDIFKLSDNQWSQPQYIEVSDSPFLSDLVGQTIYTAYSQATALVESFNIIRTNNKVINVLYLSNINGDFFYNDTIFSNDVQYSISQAPQIIGSLSGVSINSGGQNFNLGDLVSISGSGSGGVGRVSSITQSTTGQLLFNLDSGGFGYTLTSNVQIIGGGGYGAAFSIGSISNTQVLNISTDIVNNYVTIPLEIGTSGFNLVLNNVLGTFSSGEIINAYSTNSVSLDFKYIGGNNSLISFETLSNTAQGISVEVINVDNPSYLRVKGTDANLAAIVANTILYGTTSLATIYINSILFKEQNSANGKINSINGSTLTILGANDYIIPTSNVRGLTSGATGVVQQIIRNTNWGFPGNTVSNLDSPINAVLSYNTSVVGSISSLANVSPGAFYTSPPQILITNPSIIALDILDSGGGLWGNDAVVSTENPFANGVATTVQILSSGFGFEPGELLSMTNANNPSIITGFAILNDNGEEQGNFTTNRSFLSDQMKLQDSYYYQNYSYEIAAQRTLNTYQDLVETLCGPVGYLLFGKYWVNENLSCATNLVLETEVQMVNNTIIISEL